MVKRTNDPGAGAPMVRSPLSRAHDDDDDDDDDEGAETNDLHVDLLMLKYALQYTLGYTYMRYAYAYASSQNHFYYLMKMYRLDEAKRRHTERAGGE